MSISSAAKSFVNSCKVKVGKYSPQICLALGIAGVVGGTVLACHATLKVGDKIEERDNKLEDLKKKYVELLEVKDIEETECNETTVVDISSNNDYKHEVLKVHAMTALNIAKDYAPAVVCSGIGITLLCHGHNTLNKRYIAMTAAYGGLQKSFNDYRENVVKRFGKDVDEELMYGAVDITVTDLDTGEEKTVKVIDKSVVDENNSKVLFSEVSPFWVKDPVANLAFIELTIHNMNEKLESRGPGGIMFKNEVLAALGLPPTKDGQILGWKYDKNVVHKIDAGIYSAAYNHDQAVIDFLDGDEPNIWLNLNVDGNVYELI